MSELILHSFEAGLRGKPDEIETQLSELAAAHILSINPKARFDLRLNGSWDPTTQKNKLSIRGEITKEILETPDLIPELNSKLLKHFNQIYKSSLPAADFVFDYQLNPQASPLAENQNAGDMGTSIAVAFANTPNNLPWERYLAVGIRDLFDESAIEGLQGDGKVEVNALYKESQFEKLVNIKFVLAHTSQLSEESLREQSQRLVTDYLAKVAQQFMTDLGNPEIILANIGNWNGGGWKDDAGSREAKPYRDGFATHGVSEDSFAGEDPSKPSASFTLLARHIAVSLVQSGLASFARVTLGYDGSRDEKVLNIYTNGTAKLNQTELEQLVKEKFSFGVLENANNFGLYLPKTHELIAQNADFFSDPRYPWNKAIIIN